MMGSEGNGDLETSCMVREFMDEMEFRGVANIRDDGDMRLSIGVKAGSGVFRL